MTTEILTSCNGKIGNLGYCDKCGVKSEITSSHCIRLIPVEQAKLGLSDVSQQRELLLTFVKWLKEDDMLRYEDKHLVDWFLKVNNCTLMRTNKHS